MKWTSLDTIVKGMLIAKGYPIHYYGQFLYFGARAYEELHFDSLQSIKTVKLPVDQTDKTVQLPCDCMDIVKIGVPTGQFIRPMTYRPGLNPLSNYDDDGNPTLYGQSTTFSSNYYDGSFFRGYGLYFNENGEFRGRFFGYGNGDNAMSFTLRKEEGIVRIHEGNTADHIILQYITDGSSVDNLTMITPYAKSAIEAYITWKVKENSRVYGIGERMEARRQWEHQHQVLRARLNQMSAEDIRQIVRKNTRSSIK